MVLGTVVILSAGALLGGTKTFNKADDWGLPGEIKEAGGILTADKSLMLVSEEFPIDITKKYTFRYSVRAQNLKGDNSSLVFAGFKVFDKENREITCASVRVVSGTDSVLTADVKAGAMSIMVKDGSKIEALSHALIVFNTSENRSDLPNFNILANDIKSAAKKGDVWEIIFGKPVLRDLKAGTNIREHVAGGNLYTGIDKVKEQWVTKSASLKGFSHLGTYDPSGWPAGTSKAQILFLINWGGRDKIITQLKDISLTEE